MQVPISDIFVPKNRQRTSHDTAAAKELAESISRVGLIQPIVVRPNGSGSWFLVAGERRLRAVQLLGWDTIPVVETAHLNEADLFEVELDENLRRLDLPWQDRIRAIAKLRQLRMLQASTGAPAPTLTSLARELSHTEKATSADIEEVRDGLVLAQHLGDAEISSASSAKEAFKVLRRKLEATHRAQLAEKFDLTSTPHTPILGDCLDTVRRMLPDLFDCICTDPPYGMGADSFGEQFNLGHDYDDSKESFEFLMTHLAPELFRICKPEAHLYMFCDKRKFDYLGLLLSTAGFDVWPLPLIWSKNGQGALPQPEHGPRRSYECILFANKGRRRTVSIRPDVISISPVSDLKVGAQKPVGVYVDLLMRSCLPGDSILDFCMGSGTIFVAANALKLRATGIESSQTAYNIALSRITERAVEGLTL